MQEAEVYTGRGWKKKKMQSSSVKKEKKIRTQVNGFGWDGF